MRGTLYRGGPALWEVGDRQLRHCLDGFMAAGRVQFTPPAEGGGRGGGGRGGGGGGGGGATALQRFVDDEPYRRVTD